MKKLNKLMAVGLSLAMCAGLAVPAFAVDAYFYGKIEGTNDWVDLGKGGISDDIPAPTETLGAYDSRPIDGVVTADGKLSTEKNEQGQPKVTAPEKFGDVTRTNANGTTTTYEYDDGKSETEVGQYSYDVEWTGAKWCSGAGNNSGGNAYVPNGTNTPHVDGEIKLHENKVAQVVINSFNEETEAASDQTTTNGTDYVREQLETTDDQVTDALNTIVSALNAAGKDLNNEEKYTSETVKTDDGQFVKTYTEITYTVTYNSDSRVAFDGQTETHGKASGHTAREGLGSQYVPGVGTYVFNSWGEPVKTTVDGKEVWTYTADVTLIPELIDIEEPVEAVVEIDEPAIPLAEGPITRAQFIDYLWRHEGEPDSDGVCTFTDVPEDHEYFDALCWAEENEVAFAYEDGTFEPDELVTVGAAREFLDNFANVFGTNAVDASELTTLTGDDGEAVLNCGEVLAEFFGEEYVVPEDLDSLETDTAA